MATKPKLQIVEPTGESAKPKPNVRHGNVPWNPSPLERRTVERCMAIGFTQEQTAAVLGVSSDSLQRRCRKELDTGFAKIAAKVGGKLLRKCLAGDTQALIFFARTRLGWNEKQLFEHSGQGGGPIVYDHLNADAAAFTNRVLSLGQRYLEAAATPLEARPLEALPSPPDPPPSEIN